MTGHEDQRQGQPGGRRERRSNRQVTIADIARQAGVSKQTVSRALNDAPDISPATRKQILCLVEQLDYRPSLLARGLATSHTRTFGLIVPDIANPFFPEIARGAAEAARAAGYSLLLYNTFEDPAEEVEALRTLETNRVAGLVLCSSRLPDDQLAELCGRHPLVVLVNRELPGLKTLQVRVEDAEGARAAVEHLVRSGRRLIGSLAGPVVSRSGRERARGVLEALSAAGIEADPGLHVPCVPDLDGGREAALQLLGARPGVDALVCYNDLVAVGALRACAELGRRVPDDVAVVGNDDIPLARLVTPSLTTLHVDVRGIGAAATEMLMARVQNRPNGSDEAVFHPGLVLRASAP